MSKYLSRFKQLFSSDNSRYKIADRRLFFVSFSVNSLNSKYAAFANEDIGYLVRRVEIPNFVIKGGQDTSDHTVRNVLGAYRLVENITYLPEHNDITLHFIDAETPIFENFFFPWMFDVASSEQDRNQGVAFGNADMVSNSTRFPKATIRIQMFDNQTATIPVVTYTAKEAFPVFIDTPNLEYSGDMKEHIRSVIFAFNELQVETQTININLQAQNDANANSKESDDSNFMQKIEQKVKQFQSTQNQVLNKIPSINNKVLNNTQQQNAPPNNNQSNSYLDTLQSASKTGSDVLSSAQNNMNALQNNVNKATNALKNIPGVGTSGAFQKVNSLNSQVNSTIGTSNSAISTAKTVTDMGQTTAQAGKDIIKTTSDVQKKASEFNMSEYLKIIKL